tara:strand:- start:220 stop:492 length:273 start_codon:yes stop_codon:yes gene_type:complete
VQISEHPEFRLNAIFESFPPVLFCVRTSSILGKTAEQVDAVVAKERYKQPLRIALCNGFRGTPDAPYSAFAARGITFSAHRIFPAVVVFM